MLIKVLAIDDDPRMSILVKALLEDDEFEVVTENSSRKGIELVHTLQPDIVVVDLMMPDIDGWGVCKQIRLFSQVPILILSGFDQMNELNLALKHGANAYINKPVTKQELTAYIMLLVGHTLAP